MNNIATLDQFKELKLHGMAQAYEAIIQLPINQHPGAHELTAQLAEKEVLFRRERKTQMYLRLSKLRYAARLEDIACSPTRNLTKEQISQLADCTWIHRAENIMITGATGCGKSYLACALGYQACLMGYKPLYVNMNRFIEKITLARAEGTFLKLLNQVEKVHLLIIDDFGLQPLQADIRLALLQILEERYNRKATIIAAQLPVPKWYEYIGDPTFADAIMDRLTANAHRMELKGKSMRKNNTKK